ncbi:AAA family ATPase [Bacillus salitolerans]|uniref:AAA family ATPase n=1 Tax=Bacillus salitolerans TaxID=1437434 RepID=A0ABW4LY40_9BACI
MIITKLKIYGYGKIIDKEISINDRQLQIFYGENEAGKSTLMSFIHSILFGFPSKLQNVNRYEPKIGFKYGGSMTIQTEPHGEVVVERVAGKSIGDVKVYLSDGSIHKEEKLSEILHGMDLKMYSSIFAFSLHGLQEMNAIKSEDLNEYLFSSSILGNNRIHEIEKKIAKDMEQLFKPSGKKPEINQNIDELDELSQQLQQAKGQLHDYQTILLEEIKTKETQEEVAAEYQELIKKLELLQIAEQYVPAKAELNRVINKLETLGDQSSFPIDGVHRLEQLNSHIMPIEAKINALSEKVKDMNEKLADFHIHQLVLEAENEIKSLVQKQSIQQYHHEQQATLHNARKNKQEQIESIKNSYGLKLDRNELVTLELTHFLKENMRIDLQEYESLKLQKRALDAKQETLTEELQLLQATIKQYEAQTLSAEKRASLQKDVQTYIGNSEDKEKLKERHTAVKTQVHELRVKEKKGKQVVWWFLLPLAILSIIFAAWEWYNERLVIAVSACIVSLLIGIGTKIFYGFITQSYLPILIEEEKELAAILAKEQSLSHDTNHNTLFEAQSLLAKDDQISQFVQKEKIKLYQLEQEYERTIVQFEKWEPSWREVCEALDTHQSLMKIPAGYAYETMLEMFDQLKLLQSLCIEVENIEKELCLCKDEAEQYQLALNRLLSKLQIHEMTSSQLQEVLEAEKEKARQRYLLESKKNDVTSQIDQLIQEREYYLKEREELFRLAGVEHEEAFREKGRKHVLFSHLQTEEMDLKERINYILKGNTTIEHELSLLQDVQDIEQQMYKYKERIQHLLENERDLQKRQAELHVRKQQLEEKGIYSSLLQKYESKRAVLEDQAKKWSKLAIAMDLLNQTKNYYRLVRLPEVISQAEQFFKKLTKHQYTKLFAPEEEKSFLVERRDGLRFTPNELSQATSEQLYLSLRLALANTYKSPVNFPLLIDDSFVNFDEERFTITLQVLEELSKKRQIIFFTCDRQVYKKIHTQHIFTMKDSDISFLKS